ncbi:MAG: pirin family protein [Gammaproteobacteria bacterium]|jgi:hypothetical protein|nr:pirin family protein [Gammaproteobacteria bacterium]
MLSVRQANERGHFTGHWLDSYHSFSFGEYYDPEHMGVSVLRVINDDRVIPGAGFPTHFHADMEIISYVLEGELEHKDSMGNGSVIRPGDVQRMSAGTGITHSEFNPSTNYATSFLQIWLLPDKRGLTPGYAQKHFSDEDKKGQLKLLVSADGREGSVSANTDAMMYATLLDAGQTVSHEIQAGRVSYLHVAKGSVHINGNSLHSGDAACIADEPKVEIVGQKLSEVLLFDLPVLK